jgi:hypothetical protein
MKQEIYLLNILTIISICKLVVEVFANWLLQRQLVKPLLLKINFGSNAHTPTFALQLTKQREVEQR